MNNAEYDEKKILEQERQKGINEEKTRRSGYAEKESS